MNVPKKIEPVRAFAVLTTKKSNEKYNEKEMENKFTIRKKDLNIVKI